MVDAAAADAVPARRLCEENPHNFTGLDLETVVQGTTTEEQTVHTALDGAYLDGSYYELQRGTERAARLDWGAPAEDVQDALNTLTLTDARVDIIPVGVNPSFQPDYIIRSSAQASRDRFVDPGTLLRGLGAAGAGNVATLAVVDIGNRGAAHHALLGSYDGYTYPPGAGNLDSITYDTSSLQGTTPAVVNEVLRTGSTPFSGTFSVAFNGAKTEEMEWQEAADEVEYVIEKLDTIGEIRVDRTDMGLQRIPGVFDVAPIDEVEYGGVVVDDGAEAKYLVGVGQAYDPGSSSSAGAPDDGARAYAPGDDVDDHVACADSGASGYAPVAIAYVVAADAAASNDGMNCPVADLSTAPPSAAPTESCATRKTAVCWADGGVAPFGCDDFAPVQILRAEGDGTARVVDDGEDYRTYLVGLGRAFEVVVVRLDADGRYPEAYAVLASAVDWGATTRLPDDSAFGAGFGYELDTGENQVFFANNDGFGIFEVELPLAVPSTCWNAGSSTALPRLLAMAAVTRRTDAAAVASNDGFNCAGDGGSPIDTMPPTVAPTLPCAEDPAGHACWADGRPRALGLRRVPYPVQVLRLWDDAAGAYEDDYAVASVNIWQGTRRSRRTAATCRRLALTTPSALSTYSSTYGGYAAASSSNTSGFLRSWCDSICHDELGPVSIDDQVACSILDGNQPGGSTKLEYE
ncbi:hypothetical protein SO694_00158022 [Aureococcus anophagefferens]|uniref:Uncharacterized protein n=1 Tax=Aureococcus anophagefferens TaxID=44056 RepID=A0ABR1G1W4_AURAN